MSQPTLSDFTVSVTFSENTVNTTPQFLDTEVSFADAEGDFDGGELRLSGILAEDTVSVFHQGTEAGQISLSGTNVGFGGTVIGTLSGGAGSDLTISFNASATTVAIDALIQNLTYANTSNSPTASRDLVLSVKDAVGAASGLASFVEMTSSDNPFASIVDALVTKPSFIDIDNDGDLDLVLGSQNDGTFRTFRNGDTTTSGAFTELTGTNNPLDGIVTETTESIPNFYDFDGDGDLDLLLTRTDASRIPRIVIYRNGDDTSAGDFAEYVDPDDRLGMFSVQFRTTMGVADLDGDGDPDLVTGSFTSGLLAYMNGTDTTSGAFNRDTSSEPDGAIYRLASLPFAIFQTPTFVDLDKDGDADLIMGQYDGTIQTFRNDNFAAGGTFTQLTGADNPFDGVDVGNLSAPSFVDLDADGDLDMVVGSYDQGLRTFENTTSRASTGFTIAVTAENDAPIVAGLPASVTVTEDATSNLDLSALSLIDVDTSGAITVLLTASAGTMTAVDGTGVTVTGSGSAALTFVGTAAAIDAYLNSASAVQYTGVADVSGAAAATLTLTGNDGSGAVTMGVINIDITDINDAPVLTGLTGATFAENAANATPQLLDIDVSFSDIEGNFDGGKLTVKGLLAEDTISVNHQGTGTGQIGLFGVDVSYGGTVIGTVAGGVGASFAVTLNADATSAAVDALIQNLTYANTTNAPTISRELLLNVTDAAGDDLGATGATAAYVPLIGSDNPFEAIDIGMRSSPSFFDIDADGDLDLVVGDYEGGLQVWRNGTDGATGAYTQVTGADNPFDAVNVAFVAVPSFVDLDADGDLDLVVGNGRGNIQTYRNGTDGAAGEFAELTGTDNPFDGISTASYANPSFVDLDADGDLDMVLGSSDGTLTSWRNGTDGSSGTYVEMSGADNPFAGISVDYTSNARFVDLDGDGDLDFAMGGDDGTLRTYINGTNVTSGAFSEATGSANPFDGIDVGDNSAPSFADMDGDGDLDLVVGSKEGTLAVYELSEPRGVAFTVAITAENDAPVATGIPVSVAGLEDELRNISLVGFVIEDQDAVGEISITFTASAGVLNSNNGYAYVAVSGKGTATVTLTGTVTALTQFLSYPNALQYQGGADAFGMAAATLTVTSDDGSGPVTLGAIKVNIAELLDERPGTNAADTLTGDKGTDLINGYDGDDVLAGNAGVDSIYGGDGNDIINGGPGADVLFGQAGFDIVSYQGSQSGVTIDLHNDRQSAMGGAARGDYLVGFEGVIGSGKADVLIGNDESNLLNSGAGNDSLTGNDGNDTMFGGAGDDELSGGTGNDILGGGAGADVLSGGDGWDWVRYYASKSGVTVDLHVDGSGLQSASGGDANGDVLSGFEAVAGSGHADVLIGNDMANRLIGGAGDDTLTGNAGNDSLIGGTGSDLLSGGAGRDVFVFTGAFGAGNVDQIVDFNAAEGDKIRLNDANFKVLADGVLQASAFCANATGLAEDASDRIIYNSTTGDLYYDADGLGGASAVKFAHLQNIATIDETSFFVF